MKRVLVARFCLPAGSLALIATLAASFAACDRNDNAASTTHTTSVRADAQPGAAVPWSQEGTGSGSANQDKPTNGGAGSSEPAPSSYPAPHPAPVDRAGEPSRVNPDAAASHPAH